ncbi:hypothetical protein ACFE04_019934 [Oxalis oulophora]
MMNSNMEISCDTLNELMEDLFGMTDPEPRNDNSFQYSEGMSNMPNVHGNGSVHVSLTETPTSETINCNLEVGALIKQERKRIVDRKYRSRQKEHQEQPLRAPVFGGPILMF